jgi:hypothetical protein
MRLNQLSNQPAATTAMPIEGAAVLPSLSPVVPATPAAKP